MSQEKASSLSEHLDLSVADARKILTLLGWHEAGGDYFTLGDDTSIRYPIIVALEFEAKRLVQLAQSLRTAAGMPSKGGNSDPYSKTFGVTEAILEPKTEPQAAPDIDKLRWGGCTVEEFSVAVKRFNDMFDRIYKLEANVAGHEQKIGKFEEFKQSLAEWLKSVVNPPGSREWILKMKPDKNIK
jgi:hypothetical protein